MKGYHGKVLEVDLTTKNFKEVEISERLLEAFVGGCALGAALLYKRLNADLDPYSPEAPLAFVTGAFTGFSPFSGRHAVCGKSPLTGLWGESTVGGFFGVELKRFGVDALIITGKASNPTYLVLREGKVEFREADHFWGKSVSETAKKVKEETDKKARVMCIGPAGERLVRFASVIDENHRAAGRTGMGAVMGSKNLKAIAVIGQKGLPEVAHPNRVKELYSLCLEKINANPGKELWHTYGTLMYTTQGYELGDTPTKYFQEGVFPAFKISGEALIENYEVENEGCALCPVICGHRVRGVKMEYESIGSLGSNLGIYDLDYILDLTHICNEMGMDSISAGVSLGFAMYLSEKEVLKDGVQWGDGKRAIEVLRSVAFREGLGDLIAEGTLKMAQRLGIDPEEAACVKGLEIPMHDPRAFSMQALCYATGIRGACHMRSDYFTVDIAAAPIPEIGVVPTDRFEESEEKVKMMVNHQNAKEVWNSGVICMLGIFDINDLCAFYSAITGKEVKPQDIVALGEKSFMLKRMLNLKLGMSKEHEKLPQVILRPLKKGGTGGFVPNLQKTLKIYYSIRGISEDGYPTQDKLSQIGIEDLVR